ncbi:MAG: dihydrodipicolinate synthase family protein [Oscillospiraceae bacterium]|nr:dihydrodipicolinate synthase family protein [Oscillospiraceae bacterium]
MKAMDFKGIIPPIQTAFKADGSLDKEGTRNIVRFTLPHVQAYYPLGTYGTGPLMSLDERKEALEVILDETNGKIPVIAHVGTPDTKSAVELVKHAKAAGASAVGSISPYYAPHLPEELLYHYFMDLMEAAGDMPLFVYNNAHYCQNVITPGLLQRLAGEGLRGCKDSSFDLVNFYNFKEAVKDYPDFNVIIGTEAIFVPAFEAGATGCVCGIGNIFPELLKKMYDQTLAGNTAEALKTQAQILRIRAITKLAPTIPVMHCILELRGVNAGMPRRPYLPLDDSTKALVKSKLQAIQAI